LVATASATQDIVVDASGSKASESEQAAGMASHVAAYRIGMLASTAGALFLVSGFEALGLPSTTRSAGYRHGGAGRRRHDHDGDRDRAGETAPASPNMRGTILAAGRRGGGGRFRDFLLLIMRS
jgi:hypothetical protein